MYICCFISVFSLNLLRLIFWAVTEWHRWILHLYQEKTGDSFVYNVLQMVVEYLRPQWSFANFFRFFISLHFLSLYFFTLKGSNYRYLVCTGGCAQNISLLHSAGQARWLTVGCWCQVSSLCFKGQSDEINLAWIFWPLQRGPNHMLGTAGKFWALLKLCNIKHEWGQLYIAWAYYAVACRKIWPQRSSHF